MGKLCHWLESALDPVVTSLAGGAIYPWRYQGTPYEKVICPEGVITEYILCSSPTESGIVVKITRASRTSLCLKPKQKHFFFTSDRSGDGNIYLINAKIIEVFKTKMNGL